MSDTAYRRYERVKSALADLFSRAEHFRYTHDRIMAGMADIRASKDHGRLRQYERFAISELYHFRANLHYRHLVWRLGPADGPLPEGVDGWKVNPDTGLSVLGELSRTRAIFGGHFYIGTDQPFNGYVHLDGGRRHAAVIAAAPDEVGS